MCPWSPARLCLYSISCFLLPPLIVLITMGDRPLTMEHSLWLTEVPACDGVFPSKDIIQDDWHGSGISYEILICEMSSDKILSATLRVKFHLICEMLLNIQNH